MLRENGSVAVVVERAVENFGTFPCKLAAWKWDGKLVGWNAAEGAAFGFDRGRACFLILRY